MIFYATFAIARLTASARLIRRSYAAFRRGDHPRSRAAVLAIKHFDFYN